MERKATAAEVRAHYKASAHEVRISRDGRVTMRPDPDCYPGQGRAWLDGRYVSEYLFSDGGFVRLR
jgi:hypothetical protein